MQFLTRVGLVAAMLAYVQLAQAFTVTITQISCSYLYFTLVLSPAESGNSQYLGVYQGTSTTNMISEIQFNAAYASTNSYQWYAPFFTPLTNSGVQQVSFRLLDQNEEPITTYPTVTQPVNFQCGTTVTTSSAASSSPTGSSGSGSNSGSNSSGNGSSDSSNSGTSSGSSSSTGAIAGGVAGGVVALLIIGLLAFCLMRRKKKQQQRAQQSRLRNDEADEAAFRAPNNNDSTASLATAPETANTPMMRDIGTNNVFADPTASGVSGAPSGSSTVFTANNQAASKPSSGSSIGASAGASAASAAGGIGAAAIAARKQSREQSREQQRSHSPARASEFSPSTESFKDTPSSQSPPPVPALPAAVASSAPAQSASKNSAPTSQPASQDSAPASYPKNSSNKNSAATGAAAAAVGTGAVAAAAANKSSSETNTDKNSKAKSSKWGFKRASKDMGNSSKPPYPQAVAEPAASSAPATKSTPSPPASNSPEMPASPTRSFKVIQKQPSPAPGSTAGPSNASAYGARSGPATPAGSIRGNNYSRAPSVASMSAGFADAPPLPAGAASVSSAPVGEFGGNMAGVGAGRSFAASSGNSTKWHQQSYNVMPNFSQRALARSTQLDEDLIFGNLGMGLNAPQPGVGGGNGSETASSKSRGDPFGDR